MDTVFLAARLLIAAAFAVAGAAKLPDLSGSRRAGADFGIPAWAARPTGVSAAQAVAAQVTDAVRRRVRRPKNRAEVGATWV